MSHNIKRILLSGVVALSFVSASYAEHLKIVDSEERLLSDISTEEGNVSFNMLGMIYERRAYPHKITYTRSDGKRLLRLSRNKDGFKIFGEHSNKIKWTVGVSEKAVTITAESQSDRSCYIGRTSPSTVKAKSGDEYLGQVEYFDVKKALAIMNTKGESIAGAKFERISFAPAVAFCPSLEPVERYALMAELLVREK
jgi:hypothetical protein